MKKYCFIIVLFALVLTSCGQTGPLYLLPKDKPANKPLTLQPKP